jgi:hypothetical protein
VFPVRYELDFYILFRRNSVFKGLSTGRTLLYPSDGHGQGTCGKMWNMIFPLLDAVVSILLYRWHTNTAVVHNVHDRWKYMPGKFECLQKIGTGAARAPS